MTYLEAPKKDFYMEFRLNDTVVLNKTTTAYNATLSGKTKLISTTEKPHTNNLGVCLLLDTGDRSLSQSKLNETRNKFYSTNA